MNIVKRVLPNPPGSRAYPQLHLATDSGPPCTRPPPPQQHHGRGDGDPHGLPGGGGLGVPATPDGVAAPPLLPVPPLPPPNPRPRAVPTQASLKQGSVQPAQRSTAARRAAVVRVACSAEQHESGKQLASGAAAAALALAISFTGVEAAQADISGLTPCSESKAFAKRQTNELKVLNKRLKQVGARDWGGGRLVGWRAAGGARVVARAAI